MPLFYGGGGPVGGGAPAPDARQLAHDLPSTGSRDFGRPFAEVFKAYKGDFYAMDRLLFSPAQVSVTALDSGRSFSGGRVDPALLDASFSS